MSENPMEKAVAAFQLECLAKEAARSVHVPDESWEMHEHIRCNICSGPMYRHPENRMKIGCKECKFSTYLEFIKQHFSMEKVLVER